MIKLRYVLQQKALFTTSDGVRHGLSSFTKLKIWDEELLQLTKELQKQSIKLSTNERYNQLQRRIKSYFKNEICRILNKLAKKMLVFLLLKNLILEQQDFLNK